MAETMNQLKESITKIVQDRFPESFIRTQVSTLGGSHRPSLAVSFALGKDKGAWPSGIIHNDKGHTIFHVHCKQDEAGTISNLELDGSIYGFYKEGKSDKAGWRDIKKPTDIDGILKNVTKYFDNMKTIHQANDESIAQTTPTPELNKPVIELEDNPLAKKYISISIIDKRTLLATIEKLPDTLLNKDNKLADLYSFLSRNDAHILSSFSEDHKELYTQLCVLDKNQSREDQIPRNIRDISNGKFDRIKFFNEAFLNDKTGKSYDIPADIRTISEQICTANNIYGLSDPMYIANITALELGRGDGKSTFYVGPTDTNDLDTKIDKLAKRLSNSYSHNILNSNSIKGIIMHNLNPHLETTDIEKSHGITRHNVGDKVIIAPKNLQTMINGNHSIKAYPSDSYIAKVKEVAAQGTEGVITHTFPPGYEVSARFGEQAFHMKDNYITNLTQTQSDTPPTYPALTPTEKKELTDFTSVIKQNFPDAKTENLEKLCNIASDMKKYTIQNSSGTMPTEKFNDLTDHQEKQAMNLIKDLPGTKIRFDYEYRGAAIKLELPQGQTNGIAGYNVPEIPKNKLTLPEENSKTVSAVKKR